MSKSFLIDTTLCTACRGCQVACKQWHNLPAEETVNRGSYQKHLTMAKKKHPAATLLDPDDVRTVYLVGFDPNLYHENAVASTTAYGISRQAALRKMLRPVSSIISRLG